MTSIKMAHIQKKYDNGSLVITDLNLTISDGELLVLVGPSGCGKSTLLRMVAGLEQITSGELFIGDNLVNNCEPADRDIAMVFQNYALYPHMTVRANLEYGLKNRKTPSDEIKRRVEEAATMLEIESFLDRKPKQLSGGQRQRVAMGRAIVRKPQVFLFDEPLSNLDAKLRGQMRIEIKKLQRKLATTSIYVTHDQLEAMTLADRLVVMNKGNIEQIGTPTDIYDYPETMFVASFIGAPSMNFFDRVEIEKNSTVKFRISKETDILGFRPEAAILGDHPEIGPVFHGIVELIEPVNAGCHVLTRWNDKIVTVEMKERFKNPGDSKLTFSVPLEAFHPYNKTSGKRTHL